MRTLIKSLPDRTSRFLDLIPGHSCYNIDKVSGKKLIIETKHYSEPARSVYVNSKFPVNQDTPANKTKVMVCRLDKNKSGFNTFLRKLFHSIDLETEEICLTQHQIINLIQKRPKFLGAKNGKTLFLIKGDGSFIVAYAKSKYPSEGPIELVPIHLTEFIYVELDDINAVVPQQRA